MYRNNVDTSGGVTQFSEIELPFEFRDNNDEDPFVDIKSTNNRQEFDIEAFAGEHAVCRGQICRYVQEWAARQHRQFAFSIYIGDPWVRFILWDCRSAGAIVSEKFNYREDSFLLVEFLWRFVHLDDEDTGAFIAERSHAN